MDLNIKKNMEIKICFQLPEFCAYVNLFAAGHAHWGEKIFKKSTSGAKEKLKLMQQVDRLKAQQSLYWKSGFSVFTFVRWVAKCCHTVTYCGKPRISKIEQVTNRFDLEQFLENLS